MISDFLGIGFHSIAQVLMHTRSHHHKRPNNHIHNLNDFPAKNARNTNYSADYFEVFKVARNSCLKLLNADFKQAYKRLNV